MKALLVLLLAGLALAGEARAQTQPQTPRTGPNLVTNPTMSGTSGWLLASSAYDATQTHTADGSGSIRIPIGTRLDTASNIAVTAGKTYIFSAFIKVTTWPPPLVDLGVGLYNASGTNYANDEAGMGGNSAPNVWEEISMIVTPTQSGSVSFVFYRGYTDSGGAPNNMWVDDVYFGENIGFASPPTAKIPFDGTNVKVDALGNVTVLKAGVFQPFFPLCIYADGRRPNRMQVYSDQGWNCNMWGYWGDIAEAANAVSSFNPDGLMTSAQAVWYSNTGGQYWSPTGAYVYQHAQLYKDTGKFGSHFLFWYWDNENVWDQWQNHMSTIGWIQDADKVSGFRTHPLYMLQGSYGAARIYHTATGTGVRGGPDMTGVYSGSANTGGAGHAGSQEIIQNQEGQNVPVVVEQMNIVTAGSPAGEFRRLIYNHIQRGAKGIGIWRDCPQQYYADLPGICASAGDITAVAWAPDIPNLRTELDAMLPMLRQPHWTSWSVAATVAAPDLSIGTRDFDGKGHIMLTNNSTTALTRTLTITGLPYTALSVVNYFTGATVTTVSGNSFPVTLPGIGVNSGTAVYRLEGTVSTLPAITSALSASGTVGSAFSYQILATNTPTSYGASALPAGLTVNTSTGLISGTPTIAGTFSVTLSATNATGTGSAVLTLTLAAAPLPPQLLLHWAFNEVAGTTAADISGHGTTGTLIGAPTWKPGLLFDGTTQYVQNTTLSWPVGQPITVALWVYTAGGTPGGAFNVGGSTHRIGAHIPYSDNILYWDYGPAFPAARITTNFTAYLNRWTHVALVSNGSTFKAIYLNGQLITSDTVAGAPSVALTGVEVGRYNVGGAMAWYAGRIRDFRLYTSVLTAPDILALYYATGRRPSIRRAWQ